MNTQNDKNTPADSQNDVNTMLANRVKKNMRRLKGWVKQNNITCYRIYNLDIPQIPLIVDWYENRLHCSILLKRDAEPEQTLKMQKCISALAEHLNIKDSDVFIKHRTRSEGGSQYGQLKNREHTFTVSEGGHKFIVNLSDKVDTGLFLDHRTTRKMVEQESKGKRVLNLFAYTGSFTVYAAAGGAATTATVDLSNRYLEAAKENMQLNGFTGFNHSFIKGDVLSMLKNRDAFGRFDLIILDPPTVSTSKVMEQKLVIQNDHKWMINESLNLLARGGVLYFSTNYKNFKLSDDIAASHIEEITDRTVPPDFFYSRPHRCYRILK